MTVATPARATPTHRELVIEETNASRAAWASWSAVVAELSADGEGGPDVVGDDGPHISGEVVGLAVEVRGVAAGGDAADDRDPERTSDFSDGVVHGGADTRTGRREGRHDQLGRGGHGDPGAESEQGETDPGREVGGALDERGLDGDASRRSQGAGGDGDAAAEPVGDMGADAGAEHHPDCGGHQGHAGGERGVAEDELQVLGLEEHGPGHGEEQQGQGDAPSGEAAVGEEPHVEHRLVTAELPADERRRPRPRRQRRSAASLGEVQPCSGASMMA